MSPRIFLLWLFLFATALSASCVAEADTQLLRWVWIAVTALNSYNFVATLRLYNQGTAR